MLEELIKIVKENAGEAIINNPAVPNKQNEEAVNTTAGSIFDSLKGMISGGNLESVTSLLQGNGSQETIKNISDSAVGSLTSKLGIDSTAASGIVQNLIPVVMNKFINKTNDPNDKSLDLQGILDSLTGGDAGGVFGMIKGFFSK